MTANEFDTAVRKIGFVADTEASVLCNRAHNSCYVINAYKLNAKYRAKGLTCELVLYCNNNFDTPSTYKLLYRFKQNSLTLIHNTADVYTNNLEDMFNRFAVITKHTTTRIA